MTVNMTDVAVLKYGAGTECQQAGHANGFVARMAAMLMDPNQDFSLKQCHAMASAQAALGSMSLASVENGSVAPSSSVGQGGGTAASL